MSSRPSSRASTIREHAPAQSGPPPLDPEREAFLVSALARLNLSRPCTPALPRSFRPESKQVISAETHDDPGIWCTLSTASSTAGGECAHRPSHSSGTRPLLSEASPAQAYADSVVLATLSASEVGMDASWAYGEGGGAAGKRLVFYQALLVQFERCTPEELPASITGCRKILCAVHICIPRYLDVVRAGGCVATGVEQFKSVKALREFLQTGSKKARAKKRIPRDLAKSEMLKPFLITLS
ncbi:hypothetical protein JCM10449v2_005466 [Rhodotorula kratochvilovae]